jgi:hypothetical protein
MVLVHYVFLEASFLKKLDLITLTRFFFFIILFLKLCVSLLSLGQRLDVINIFLIY